VKGKTIRNDNLIHRPHRNRRSDHLQHHYWLEAAGSDRRADPWSCLEQVLGKLDQSIQKNISGRNRTLSSQSPHLDRTSQIRKTPRDLSIPQTRCQWKPMAMGTDIDPRLDTSQANTYDHVGNPACSSCRQTFLIVQKTIREYIYLKNLHPGHQRFLYTAVLIHHTVGCGLHRP
jgi:hypothetical protein